MKRTTFLLLCIINTITAQNWTEQNPLPPENELTSIYFVDENTGFSAGRGGSIIKTTDGGTDYDLRSFGLRPQDKPTTYDLLQAGENAIEHG